MDKNYHKLYWRIGLFLAGIFIFGLSFSIPGVMAAGKPDVITVVCIGDFSGPYAPILGAIPASVEDAWEYLNNELGGVRGVKVKPIMRDMKGKMDLGLFMYTEMINMKPKSTFIDIWISPLSEALRERYVEDDAVGFHAGTVKDIYPVGNCYSYYALYPEQMAVALKWIKDRFKEKRNPRFGIITWDTAYGRGILTDEFFAYAKRIGVDIVETQLFGIRDVDVTTQLIKLREKKPDYLATNTAAAGPWVIHKGLKEIGWKIPLVNTLGSDWGTVNMGPDLFEEDIVVMPYKSLDETNDPSIKTIMRYFNQNKRTPKERTLFYVIPWVVAVLEHNVMTKVVDKYGWEGLSTKNIIKVLNSVKNFAPINGITRISFSAKRRSPNVARVYKISGGKILPLSNFMEVPDMRPQEYR
jgi:branched-chain amino acid transport system substrate-binding protein